MTQYIEKSTKQDETSNEDKSETTVPDRTFSSEEYEVLGLIESFSQQTKANALFHQNNLRDAIVAYTKSTKNYPLAQYLNLEKIFAIICLSGDEKQGLDILQKLYKQKPGLESSLNTPEFVYYEFLFHEWNGLEEKATVFLDRLKKNPSTAYKKYYITEAVKVRVSTFITNKQYDNAEKEMAALKGILSDEDFAFALNEFHASTNVLRGVKAPPKAPASKAKIEKEYIKEDSTESKHYNISLAIQANDLVYLSKVTPTDMHEYHQHYKNSLFVRDIGNAKLKTSWFHENQKFLSNDEEIIELPGSNKEYVLVVNNVFRKLDTSQQKVLDSAVKTGIAARSHGADGIIRNKGFFEIKSLHKGLKDVRAYADTALKNPAGYILYIVDKVGNHKNVKKHAAVKHIECAFTHDHETITSSISGLSSLENNNTTLSLIGKSTESFHDTELNG